MKRYILFAALFFVSLLYFKEEIGGSILRSAVEYKTGLRLECKEIAFGRSEWVLRKVAFFNPDPDTSPFMLQASEIRVEWPLRIHFEKPHLTLSEEWIAWLLTPTTFEWDGVASEGTIDWNGISLPPASFSFLKKGALFEELHVQVEGKELVLDLDDHWGRAAISLDWSGTQLALDQPIGVDEIIRATQQCRLGISNGEIAHGGSVIREARLSMSHQAGIGAKWEGSAIANGNHPIRFEAKMSFHPDHPFWADGEWSMGAASGSIAWDVATQECRFEWNRLGTAEIALIQDFGQSLTPLFADWDWVSGTFDGAAQWKKREQRLDWERLNVSDLHLRSRNSELVLANWNGSWNHDAQKFVFGGVVDAYPAALIVEKKGDVWDLAANIDSLIQINTFVFFDRQVVEAKSMKGALNGLFFEGEGSWDSSSGDFSISVPQFSGRVTPWHTQTLGEGTVASIDSGFWIDGNLREGISVSDWSLALAFSSGSAQIAPSVLLNEIGFELHADPQLWDLSSLYGVCRFSAAEKTIEIPFEAPRLKVEDEIASFDFRCRRKTWDFLRIVGEKKGGVVRFDPTYSHLMGKPLILDRCLFDKEGLLAIHFASSFSLPLLQTLISEANWSAFFPIEGDLSIEGLYERGEPMALHVQGLASRWDEKPFPIDFKLEKSAVSFAVGSWIATGAIGIDRDVVQIKEGKAIQTGAQLDFEGKLTSALRADFILSGCKGDARALGATLQSAGIPALGLDGTFEGSGFIALSPKGIEADLDILPQSIHMQGFEFENEGPIHLYFSSSEGAVFSGLDCRVRKDGAELLGKVGLCRIDAARRRYVMQKAHLHFPGELLKDRLFGLSGEIDLLADIECAFDLSELTCDIKEAFLPIGGAVRRLENLHLFTNREQLWADSLLFHQGNSAKVSLQVDLSPTVEGSVLLDDLQGGVPLMIDWSRDSQGISIRAIEGGFAGVDASFHAQSIDATVQLIGSARIDFSRLSSWIPPKVGAVFQTLQMGKGYELKGHLFIDRNQLDDIRFQGIFSGKQLDLFGYELRTLLAQTELSADAIRIYDLKISDTAGILKIDDLWIGTKNGEPWTLEIPKLVVEDLRPSLLSSAGAEPKPISPLLVRRLSIADFRGQLDDGKTYRAKGELTFINSFKREDSLLDFPASLFGRIIGLDLDLLIPVKGDLTFELKDGYFTLLDLNEAYSEGNRSQFFLVNAEDSPRMDLEGNLQILIQMKQFVLFKFTDAFMISVEGKLNDPQFRLQKKRRFLSLGL